MEAVTSPSAASLDEVDYDSGEESVAADSDSEAAEGESSDDVSLSEGGLTLTITYRLMTEIEKRIRTLEQTQEEQDEAIVELASLMA